MKRALAPGLFSLLGLAVATGALPVAAIAQSLVPLSDSVATAAQQDAPAEQDTMTDAAALSAFERWQAEPTTFLDANDITLAQLVWNVRPLIIFADSPNDPNFRQQIDLLEERVDALALRDVMVILDTDPANPSPIRTELRPRGFGLVLIGKDGRVAQRKPVPWQVRELTAAIDKMPIRQQEIRDGRTRIN